MAQLTSNSTNITRQIIYSDGLMEGFDNKVVGMLMMNDVTDQFPDGDTFDVDQIADATLTAYTEDTAVNYAAITLSRIQLTISDYKQDGFYLTDAMQMDSWKSDLFFSKRIKRSMVAFAEDFESQLYIAADAAQTPSDPNDIDGLPHRIALATGYTGEDFYNTLAKLKESWDVSNVPAAGRMLVVPPNVERTLNTIGANGLIVLDSPRFEGLVESGFARDHQFLRNILGFDVFVSNLLPVSAGAETVDTIIAAANHHTCIAFSVADDDSKAMMGVIRQKPTPEHFRDTKLKRDEWSATSRYGFAAYRPESLSIILASPTA